MSSSFIGSCLESVSAFYCLARFHLTDYRWSQYVEQYCTIDFARNQDRTPVDLSEATLAPFRDRLVRLVRFATASGARPVLCTMAHRALPQKDDPVFLELMSQQNAAIREVARLEGALLADLDAVLTGKNERFIDGIHTDAQGAAAKAAAVAECVARDGAWGERRPR